MALALKNRTFSTAARSKAFRAAPVSRRVVVPCRASAVSEIVSRGPAS